MQPNQPSGDIPTRTASSAMPVKEPPHEQRAAGVETQPAATQTGSSQESPKSTEKPKKAGQSAAGIIVTTLTAMTILALLTIVVYLKS